MAKRLPPRPPGKDGDPPDAENPQAQLPALIPEEVREQLKDKPEVLHRLEILMQAQITHYQGPWIPPEYLSQYPEHVQQVIVQSISDRTAASIRNERTALVWSQVRLFTGNLSGILIAGGCTAAAAGANIWSPGWPSVVFGIFAIALGVGGPFAARIFLDRNYLSHQKDTPAARKPPKKR